jgi:hypothetical protein
MGDTRKEYIICSAILYDDGKVHVHQPKNIETGIVICGRRHHNCIHTAAILLGERYDKKLIDRANQGFLTNLDRFVDRKEGMQIAKKAGQLINPALHKDSDDAILTSEDLYSEDLY